MVSDRGECDARAAAVAEKLSITGSQGRKIAANLVLEVFVSLLQQLYKAQMGPTTT